VLLVFSNGIHRVIPLAAWLAPIFLIRFTRSLPKGRGLLILLPFYCVAWVIMQYGIYPDLGVIGSAFGFSYGLFLFLPFLADRLLAPKTKGLLSTLVFPSAWVIIEYALASIPYTGSWFALAYTQLDNLPLIQLVSITGIYGISFLMSWFASVVNWAWEQEFSISRIRKGAALYLGILALVLLFGGAYVAFAPAGSDTVRVAAITRSFDVDERVAYCKETFEGEELSKCYLTGINQRSLDEFLEGSRQAADAGAKIVVWQENGLVVREADEAEYVAQARELAAERDIYLVMGAKMVAKDRTRDENKLTLVSPDGETSEYLKNHKVAGDDHILGDGKVLFEDSPYGKLALLICYDADFPAFVRQAGRADADVMLIPAQDWAEITPLHGRMPTLGAIENGYSLIRNAYHGVSIAVDYHGKMLSTLDNFTTDERVMIADLPTQGIPTLYSRIGDLFAWLCVAGFLGLIVLAIANRKQA
jgi:apolipoprotein N-acyltransferase